jgi:hypothetical protein
MSNLTVQTASAVSRLPENNMANVIDALKRLERVGSEASKTTEKLIAAATAMSELIVQFYDEDESLYFTVKAGNDSRFLQYLVQKKKNDVRKHLFVVLQQEYVYVGANRAAATKFAEDIAAGLIDLIADDLEKRTTENDASFSVIAKAIESLQKKQ